jgi:serine/threonine protein kinase
LHPAQQTTSILLAAAPQPISFTGTGHKLIMEGPSSSWHKADMWSVGAIALFLWTGVVPDGLEKVHSVTPQDVHELVARCIAEASCHPQSEDSCHPAAFTGGFEVPEAPQGLLDLLSGCLLTDPAKRSTAEELLLLPWFAP